MTRMLQLLLVGALLAATPALARAQDDTCADNPLFTRMPNYVVYSCESAEFDAKQFPVGFAANGDVVHKTVEGAYSYVTYQLTEGAKTASPLQIVRNHLAAARAAGGKVIKEFGAVEHQTLSDWSDIQQHAATLTLAKDTKDVWVHVGSVNDGEYYAIAMVERQAMAQVVGATELFDQLSRSGMVTLEVHFDNASAALRPESAAALDQAAEMLKVNPTLRLEVGGHTDNVGAAEANLVLSQQRADAVRSALVERGIAATRVTAKGYGATAPVADNRTDEGRARNRRVELTKQS